MFFFCFFQGFILSKQFSFCTFKSKLKQHLKKKLVQGEQCLNTNVLVYLFHYDIYQYILKFLDNLELVSIWALHGPGIAVKPGTINNQRRTIEVFFVFLSNSYGPKVLFTSKQLKNTVFLSVHSICDTGLLNFLHTLQSFYQIFFQENHFSMAERITTMFREQSQPQRNHKNKHKDYQKATSKTIMKQTFFGRFFLFFIFCMLWR